ncbi:FMN-binding domain protein [Clostridium argentinense CDC 2741]|uniref:FMN-binding domain protein n=1 Tax=Clostridium argentinense CDC 2741 TaxID=1418104 RepID=A0A0C1TZ19_9CLOT|nr:FMN-binding protein [Clostridium argentinense]ARC84387.1 FMN-binding domain-containing protein [Clostridium argentinense]KIE44488.1 FMN-binding domain protein [Clostridium argentinense CDC 2741]NFF41823.1 FMN-binding protein [Clostridium argentinense]NFP49057.1 FMN-binding protein [Clostridium argentinense]NFP74786.1 FMN-binding protein [Clostridium argentinense]
MNKKLVSVVSATLLAATVLVGCGSSSASKELKDGQYKAEYSEMDEHGWKAFVELKVADGKISECNADYVNEEGKLKSQDAKYEESMKGSSETWPSKFSADFNKALVEKGNPADVDNITGATHSTEDFKNLSKEALKAAEKGKTDTVVVKAAKK